MRLVETFIQTPLAGAVGWTVLHSLWEGAILSALLGIVLSAVRSPRFRYAAACLAMLLMLVTFGITLTYLMPEGGGSLWMAQAPALHIGNAAIAVDSPNDWGRDVAAMVPWLAPLWLMGVFLFYVRHVAGLLSVHRLRSRGVCMAPECWQNLLGRLSTRLQFSRPILLLESCLADTPMVIGHIRPLILMPIGVLTGLPATQIEAILLHELAHIRRYDYLVNSTQRLVEGLLFYHPAAWWISRVIRMERENCCDDIAVSISGKVREYAVALAALEQTRWSGREPAVAVRGGNLMKRIHRLLYPKRPSSAWTPLLVTLALMVTVAFSLGAWQSGVVRSLVSHSQPDRSKAAAFYSKWLNEDVVYIISEPERAAFEQLTTDQERDEFIEQFWLRRDPTPGTPEDEFKEEHYRRIAFANAHYASGKPGWQTDRGRVYIVNGPPDEIDSHPNGGPQERFPNEMWAYRHGAGEDHMEVFTFVDGNHTGDYRLAPAK
ncbi:MAG TPA: GWxTD domain-containing protein [Bryobacteraceae bacterium]|jgi:GWxTD domain-containing protein|nr:GWxTD domain-containing protein [Bryobacteraceae bacterium]